ncbi:MAG: 5-formyltetrahydrofolate cyclo-ligase [Sphingopyxis sp.]
MVAGHAVVAGYRAAGAEADPAALLAHAQRQGATIALPRIPSGGGAMTFHSAPIDAPLEIGPYGLLQPLASAPMIVPTLVLLPLLAFTRSGKRLGQGGGYYDRTLALLPDAQRVGVAWSCQEMPDLPVDLWDIPLHFIITEKEWILTS